MSEPLSSPPERTAGAMLREAREAAGLTLTDLAAFLKVPKAKLEALEAEQWQLLADPVFARALAGSMCRALKIDITPVLAAMPQFAAKFIAPSQGMNQHYRASNSARASAHWPRPAMLAAAALLVAALGLWTWPYLAEIVDSAMPFGGEVGAVQSQPETKAIIEMAANDVVTVPALPSTPLEPVTASSAPRQPLEPASQAMATESVAPAAPAAPASSAARIEVEAPGRLLTFSASADAWVRVSDAKGIVVFSRLLKAGETAHAAGALPLSVVLGRADAVSVRLRGQAMNLSQQTRENVARFEVK